MSLANVCDDVIPRCMRARESLTASDPAILRITSANSSVMPRMRTLLYRLMSGTSWFGMACMMICSTGEIGVVNEWMSTRRRAVQSVMDTVTEEEEKARDEMDSDGLCYKVNESGNPAA